MDDGRIRVLLVDDHASVRYGVQSIFASVPDIELCGLAAGGHEGIELALALDPDLILMDVSMPDLDGLSALSELRSRGCVAPVVMLSATRTEAQQDRADDLCASDYVLKTEGPQALLISIRTAMGAA